MVKSSYPKSNTSTNNTRKKTNTMINTPKNKNSKKPQNKNKNKKTNTKKKKKKKKTKTNTPGTEFLQNEINKIMNSNDMIMDKQIVPVDDDEDLTKYKNVVMLVYSETCGHCINLESAWKDLRQKRDADESYRTQILIKDINAAQNMEDELLNLKTKLLSNITENSVQVDGFPTIGHFKNREYHPYMGQRDFKSLDNWLGGMIE
jgi:hypothetical protein